MSQRTALVTGASGEMGHLLIPALASRGFSVVAVDLVAPPAEVARHCVATVEESIIERGPMRELFRTHRPTDVFHLAAVLSTRAEKNPGHAHRVNVEGTAGLFGLCRSELAGAAPVRFLFPSSIAVYGLPDARTKAEQGAVTESQWNAPTGMYGCTKLYCEMLGSYLSARGPEPDAGAVDFRSIRFPGLISADTMPSGGTTDYAPEMIHAAASGKSYSCFVSADTRLPFMTMPDAIDALLALSAIDPAKLSTRVYNIRGFSASAAEFRAEVLRHFPKAQIDFDPQPLRQALVDSWPADVDDSPARRDWGLDPKYGLSEALRDYLIPALV